MQATLKEQLRLAAELTAQGQLDRAAGYYQQLLQANPELAEALLGFGTLNLHSGQPEQALGLLQRASAQLPRHPGVWLNLARTYRQLAHTEDARAALDRALQFSPEDPLAHLESGHLYTDQADHQAAVQAYQRALSLDRNCMEGYYSLSLLHQSGDYQFSEAQLLQLQHWAEQPDSFSTDQLSLLYFTLGRIQHRASEYAAAFHSFTRANQAKKNAQQGWERYDLAAKQALLEASRRAFTEPAQRLTAGPQRQPEPIFIIGMPRTGSTLLETCLARHPRIAAAGELAVIKTIARQQLPQATGLAYPDLMGQLPDELAHLTARHVRQQLARRARQPDQTEPPRYISDKMPTNFEYLGLINRLFPGARVIHLMRDPMDTLWSCYQQNLAARYSNDFADLEGQYRCYREFMRLWRTNGIPMLELHYEALVTSFEASLRQVIDYLGLSWDKRCLDSSADTIAVTTASRMQVRKPIHTGAISAWQKYATQLGPLRQRLDDFYSDN